MLNIERDLSDILRVTTHGKIHIRKSNGAGIPISKTLEIIVNEKHRDYEKLYIVVMALRKILEYTKTCKDYKKGSKLFKELVKEIFKYKCDATKKEDLIRAFKFLNGKRFLIIRNNKIVINNGINRETKNIFLEVLKLKKHDLREYSGNNTIYAFTIGKSSIIIEGNIDELQKNLARIKLFYIESLLSKIEEYSLDELTHAYTYRKFLDDIRNFKNYALLLNMRKFGLLNRLYGIHIMDTALEALCAKLEDGLKGFYRNINVYRIRGDKFAIFPIKNRVELTKILSLIRKVTQPLEFSNPNTGEGFHINLKMNSIILDNPSRKNIEDAIYQFKNIKDSNDELFPKCGKTLQREIKKEKSIIKILKIPNIEKFVVPFFQPIVCIKNGKAEMFSYESLMRLKSPNGKILCPDDFLGISKEYGFYPKLRNAIIEKTLCKLSQVDGRVSINLTAVDIREGITGIVMSKLKELKIDPNRLIMEIVESDYLSFTKETQGVLKKVKDEGIKIAIDDFGSGYSNFSYLMEFPIDIVKIDGSIIQKIKYSDKAIGMLYNLNRLFSSINCDVVAEYVSDRKIMDKLLNAGINCLQGFYIGKPSPRLSTSFVKFWNNN